MNIKAWIFIASMISTFAFFCLPADSMVRLGGILASLCVGSIMIAWSMISINDPEDDYE